MKAPEIVRLGHVILQVTDLAASRAFYVGLLGLDVVDESDRAPVPARRRGSRVDAACSRRAALPAFVRSASRCRPKRISTASSSWPAASGSPRRRRQEVERPSLLTLDDPFGSPLAFYFASVKRPWLLQQYDRRRCPSIQRIDHVNLFAANPGQALTWYRDALGFRLTEYTEDEAGNVWAAWLHRKGNVHDVAFTNGAGPRLHHVAFWMPDAAQVLQLCDVLGASRTGAIERGPGRHGISNALYLYLRDPDGHRVEIYTSDYLTVDPDFEPTRWRLDDPYRQQLWGGLAPKSWFTEGSPFTRADGSHRPLTSPVFEGLPRYIS